MYNLLTHSEKKGTSWIVSILSQIIKIFIGLIQENVKHSLITDWFNS